MGRPNHGYVYRTRITEAEGDRPLRELLCSKWPHSDAAAWTRRISQGRVLLDGEVADPEQRVQPGQWLSWHRPPWIEPVAPLGFALLRRDPDFWVVLKAPGLPCMPGAQYLEHTLHHQVRLRDPRATLVHRLGRGTSGLVLVARTDRARRDLARQWRDRESIKTYRAQVQGIVTADEFSVETPIGPVPRSGRPGVHAACESGKHARSHFKVLERRRRSTLLEVRIETGRAHQIRIHAACCGHPLWGEPLYASGGKPSCRSRAVPGDIGYRLHAYQLDFAHPRSAVMVRVRAELPPSHWAFAR